MSVYYTKICDNYMKKAVSISNLNETAQLYEVIINYPPKLSYIIEDDSTPRLSSILTTALDIGPGPHM